MRKAFLLAMISLSIAKGFTQTGSNEDTASPSSPGPTTCTQHNNKTCPKWLHKVVGQYPLTAPANSANAIWAWKCLFWKGLHWVSGHEAGTTVKTCTSATLGDIEKAGDALSGKGPGKKPLSPDQEYDETDSENNAETAD